MAKLLLIADIATTGPGITITSRCVPIVEKNLTKPASVATATKLSPAAIPVISSQSDIVVDHSLLPDEMKAIPTKRQGDSRQAKASIVELKVAIS